MNLIALDGDGIKGLIQAFILNHIHKNIGVFQPHIDHYAGTSIGGIMALYLALSNKNTPSELLRIILDNHSKIFSGRNYTSFLYGPKYSSKGITEVAHNIFHEKKLSDLETDCTIVSYDVNTQDPFYFESHKAKLNENFDFLLTDVALATSAAPTYFAPHLVGNKMFIDGGMAANNPTFSGIISMRKMNPRLLISDINTLSIGCIEHMMSPSYNSIKKYGSINWIELILDILMNASADVTHHNVKYSYLLGGGKNYYRIDAKLDKGSSELDDISKNNISNLLDDAVKICGEYDDYFNKFYYNLS